MADGTFSVRTLGLVKHHHVAAVWALAAGHFVCSHINDMAAGTVNFLPREKAGTGLRVPPAKGAFNHKF